MLVTKSNPERLQFKASYLCDGQFLLQQINPVWLYIWGPTLRKHAYSKLLIISPPKKENFQIKNSDIFHISSQNIDCGYSLKPPRRGGSNEYHSLCFEKK